MPYIVKKERTIARFAPNSSGELNYAITVLVLEYMKRKGEKYQNYNDCLGALEGCKLELYRRRIADYENKKANENGDVYATD